MHEYPEDGHENDLAIGVSVATAITVQVIHYSSTSPLNQAFDTGLLRLALYRLSSVSSDSDSWTSS